MLTIKGRNTIISFFARVVPGSVRGWRRSVFESLSKSAQYTTCIRTTMAILKDNEIENPPPPYAAIPSISTESSSSDSGGNRGESSSGPYAFPNSNLMPVPQHHPAYGPTPITSQEQRLVLPYYDPRSPYAMQQALSRARWRFFSALLYVFGIWFAIGIVTGSIVIDVRRAGRGT